MSNIIDSIQLSGTTYQIQGSGGGVPESAFTAYTSATDSRISEDEEVTSAALNVLNDRLSEDEEVTAAGLNALNESLSGKQDTLIAGDNITISGNVISATGGGGGGITSGEVQSMIDESISGKVDTSTFNTYSGSIETALSGKVNTSAITSAITSSSTDSQVPSAKAVNDNFGGLKLVKISQSDYDNLQVKDNNTLYIVID